MSFFTEVKIKDTATVEVAGIIGTSTVTVAGGVAASITGTATVEVAGILGTSTVEVAGIVGTSTVTVAGTVTAACTGTQTVTVAGGVAASITGTATVEVAGILGTSTVEVAGIVGTSTVTVAGTVTAACTGTQTVTVVGGVAASITGTATVEVAGILGTSTVEVAGIVGTSTVEVAGIVGTSTITVSGPVTVVGDAASGAAVAGNPILIAGQNGGTVHSLQVDAIGNIVCYYTFTAADGLTNTTNVPINIAGVNSSLQVAPFLFNGSTWDRARSGSVTGATMVQQTGTGTVVVAGSFVAETVTATVTASATLAVAASTRWDVRAITFSAICSNTVTKQAAIWVTDSGGNVIWETQGPVVTPTNTLCLEHTLYPSVTSGSTYTALARGTSTSVIILAMPELVLGASYTINAKMVGAAATQTYTLCANVIVE